MHFVASLAAFTEALVNLAWGLPLVILLIGSGCVLAWRIQLLPLLHLRHAFDLLRGRFDDPDDPGEISHFQALTSALSATIGLGNIAGVAIAVSVGGPGAIFWMWIAGLVGMATKFFTCTLACLYRAPDANGVPQGGPMYFIEVGLGPRFRPLAIMFAACGMVGCLGAFQVNQLAGLLAADYDVPRVATGFVCMVGVGVVIVGGISRVGRVTARVVPAMSVLYVGTATFVLIQNAALLPELLQSIYSHAFTGGAVAGGAAHVAVREVIITGIRRAAFSNEAGIGTAALAHGAAKTREPVREGMVAMLGPFIDTNIVCTLTALVVLSSGVVSGEAGAVMTARAFEAALPGIGALILSVVIVLFSVTTMISYCYYSQKCARYLFGDRVAERYVYVYVATLLPAAMFSQAIILNILDTAFALMAVPTLTGTLLLAPRVIEETRAYFERAETRNFR